MKGLFEECLLMLCVSFLTSTSLTAQNQDSPKNIVFFLVDDLGYSDVGYLNQKPGVKTPNIDNLDKKGTIFTNAYTASPVCSPTRASILTGQYPSTLNLTCHIPGIGMEKYVDRLSTGKKLLEAEFIDHLPLDEVTLAEVLQKQGYKTAFFGKWHLAGGGSQLTEDGVVNDDYHPDHQGFDTNIGGCAYGQPTSYFSPYANATIPDGPTNEYLTDRLGDEACKFLENNKEESMLLYLSFYSVHTPHQAPPETVEKYNDIYHAMINKVDENVGQVIDMLDSLGLAESTLIVFYSDNGGYRKNPPLRDRKGSLYEGGIRVPLIFSMPGQIREGKRLDFPVTSPDLFPTLMEAAAIPSSEYTSEDLEGISLWPMLTTEKIPEERAIFWHFPHHRSNDKSMASASGKETGS